MQTEYRSRPRDSRTAPREPRAALTAGLPIEERRHTLAGIVTPVLQGGDGPPLILLHGPGEFAAKWLRVIPELVSTHQVIAPDLPGHGESIVRDGELDPDRVIAWLGELIDATCPTPPTVVGHVLGGSIAARFAIAHGHRLRRLVLVDSLGLAAFRPAPRFALAMLAFMVHPNEGTYDRFMRQCSFDLDDLRAQMGERWAPFVSYTLDLSRRRAAQTALRTLMRRVGVPAIPPDDLARIAVPTTLIWGREDRANRLRVAEEASARYGWPLHVIDECADDPPRDRPREFLDALYAAVEAGSLTT